MYNCDASPCSSSFTFIHHLEPLRIVVHGFELRQVAVYLILFTIPAAAVVVKLYK